MNSHSFDDRNIRWNKLGDFEHLLYSILDVDEKSSIADVLFKFSANEKILLHRHLAHNNTLVIQGEHRLYEPSACRIWSRSITRAGSKRRLTHRCSGIRHDTQK